MIGLQSYGRDSDATVPEWRVERLRADLFPGLLPFFPKQRRKALDVGSGNGRLGVILSDLFESFVAIDPNVELDPRWERENGKYLRVTFEEFAGAGNFDAVFFLGAFYMLQKGALEQCERLLAPGGIVIIADEIRWEDEPSRQAGYDLEELAKKANMNVCRVLVTCGHPLRVSVLRRNEEGKNE